MDDKKLFIPGTHAFYVVAMDASPFEDWFIGLVHDHKDSVIRKVRGSKSRTKTGFMNEVAAALQFPYYFGENWDAFNDLITDLGWLPGNNYVMLIPDANQLLADTDKDLQTLLGLLKNAPFHVVFQGTAAEQSALS